MPYDKRICFIKKAPISQNMYQTGVNKRGGKEEIITGELLLEILTAREETMPYPQ